MAIQAIGDTELFNYTGSVQSFLVPESGLYKLEVWGGQGASNSGAYAFTGGLGGHSTGYAKLNKGEVLYIVVGGQGSTINGGYNGGGTAGSGMGPGGGGATHIATVTGLLSAIGFTNFVSNGYGLIVAGGGGGAPYSGAGVQSGTGGGLTGGNGIGFEGNYYTATGGSQSAGGTGSRGGSNGTFGMGGGATSQYAGAGGGGGLYGGGAGGSINRILAGGGGSGYLGGVPEIVFKGQTYTPSSENGVRSGAGKAEITYIAKGFPTIYVGNTAIDAAYLGTVNIDNVFLGDTQLS